MGNIFNKDFRDFIEALNHNNVKYLLIGGYSVILHGYARTTGDLDIWVKKDRENYHLLVMAFEEFRMPVFDMTEKNFLNSDKFDVFSFGVPPVSIDLMTKVKGLDFDEAFANSKEIEIDKLLIRLINYYDLIKAKKASGRPRDIDDIQNLS